MKLISSSSSSSANQSAQGQAAAALTAAERTILHILYCTVSKLRQKSCIENIDFAKNINNVNFAKVIMIDLVVNRLYEEAQVDTYIKDFFNSIVQSKSNLSIMTLGEIGRIVDLSNNVQLIEGVLIPFLAVRSKDDEENSSQRGFDDLYQSSSSSSTNGNGQLELKYFSSRALGLMACGNPDFFVPKIFAYLNDETLDLCSSSQIYFLKALYVFASKIADRVRENF